MKSQLLRRAAFARNDEDVEVAVAIRREGYPPPVWREARISVARFVRSYALDVLAVFVGGPYVGQVSERDAPVMIVRVANEFGFATRSGEGRTKRNQESEGTESFHRVSLGSGLQSQKEKLIFGTSTAGTYFSVSFEGWQIPETSLRRTRLH